MSSDKVKIIIGGSKGDSLISSVIKWFQFGKEITHTFYCIPDTDLQDPEVIEAWHLPLKTFGGVRQGKFYRDDITKRYFYVEATKEQAEKFHKFMLDRVGKHRYDYVGVLGFAIRSKDMQRDDSYFCSELIFEAFLYVGITLLNYTKPQRVSPALLIRSPLLKEFSI